MKGKAALEGHLDQDRRRRASGATIARRRLPKIANDWSKPAVDMLKNGDADGAIGKAQPRCCRRITSPITSPMCCMEPLNATAWSRATRCTSGPRNQSVIDMELAGSIAAGTKPQTR